MWRSSSSWLRPSSSSPICGSSTTSSPAYRTAKCPAAAGARPTPRLSRCLTRTWPSTSTTTPTTSSATPPSSTPTLEAHGADPVDLDKFRTLPSSTATGAQQIGRLTNLMQLTVDTSFWTRYRSDSQNPDFGDNLPQAIPDL